MNKYCQSCNKPTSFSDSPPAYCAFCGKPFAGTVTAQIQPVQVVRPIKKVVARQIEEEYQEEITDDEYEQTPHHILPKIELDYQMPKRQRETLRGLALDKSEKMNVSRPKDKPIKNKKKFEQSWSADFEKNNRQNSSEIGGAV